ncbi:acyl-CoA dehydrogenase family protein [Hyalangium rubrum]|uniref:Acyl-CoA dehydrogenase family protein n=1 Tax=Hyalangium rubrum TaxID=3103134 RepID=A0ABU5GZ55_9BACT|nr:acyl-CoA dehydrogenase family protein [Hyalangium sp. s54d21]MDY7226346.1 acyl-CoA dehydrogenase family protein [Hyalangium sp. s54d21]
MMDALARIISETIEPNALAVDRDGTFPHAAIEALGRAGLLGLISAKGAGGMGEGLRAAAWAVERVGEACGSTGMVLCMHYCAAAVIEQHGPWATRQEIAAGRHLSTLAFSEVGSRSHFWAPVSTAKLVDGSDSIRLDADKSWATSAGQVDSYVWSSRSLASPTKSTLWLVPGKAPGLTYPAPFDGLGLRGNSSSPIQARNVLVPRTAMLGPDGGGFDIMMGNVLPHFQVLSSSCFLGIMDAATKKAAAHVAKTRLSHLSQSLADLATIRAYLARMRLKTDMVRGLLRDTLDAMEEGREDTQLRVLEVKAGAAEMATEVTELAMRVCGGAAFRKEAGLERHFRDARAASVMSPTTDLLYDFIGKAAAGMPLFE